MGLPVGVTYIVVNSSKQQWFQPDTFDVGENTKWRGILRGLSGHALAHLLAPQHQLGFHLEPWIGDDVFLAGDTSRPLPQLEPFRQDDDENPWWIATQAFSDISLNLLAELSRRPCLLAEFIESATKRDRMLVSLANTIPSLDVPHITEAIEHEFGMNWRRRYNLALKAQSPWNPQPMIPPS